MQKHHQMTYVTILKATPESVWRALTNPEVVKQYFFGSNLVTDWKPGNPIYFEGEWEGKPYRDKGVVLEFVPNRSLAYSYFSNWSNLPDQEENYLFVAYQLAAVEAGTQLTVIQTNYDAEKAEHSRQNWTAIIQEMKKLIE